MSTNEGTIDRVLRVIVGLALIGWALGYGSTVGVPTPSWSWVGWIGVVPLITGLVGNCPAYSLLGVSTCPHARA